MAELEIDMLKQRERITIFTTLGIRFWDPVQKMQISDNLTVRALPEEAKSLITTAFRTISGIYAFQGLPGLHGVEYPEDNLGPVSPKNFTIEVKDNLRRFLSVAFSVSLPLPYEGVYLTHAQNNLPIDLPGFFLFSAPTRPTLPGFAVIRGQLVEKSNNRPAAHAVLEVQMNSNKWYGVADDRGCIAILFPYPAFIGTIAASPTGKRSTLSLNQQRWDLTIRVRYAPDALKYPHGIRIPELSSILSQPSGEIWSTNEQHAKESLLNLVYNQESILHTSGLSESILWIDKGA